MYTAFPDTTVFRVGGDRRGGGTLVGQWGERPVAGWLEGDGVGEDLDQGDAEPGFVVEPGGVGGIGQAGEVVGVESRTAVPDVDAEAVVLPVAGDADRQVRGLGSVGLDGVAASNGHGEAQVVEAGVEIGRAVCKGRGATGGVGVG